MNLNINLVSIGIVLFSWWDQGNIQLGTEFDHSFCSYFAFIVIGLTGGVVGFFNVVGGSYFSCIFVGFDS